MFKVKIFVITFVAYVSLLSVHAQSNPPTCQSVNGMTNVNATLFGGDWYEEIRAPAKNVSCVQVHVEVVNNQTQLNIKSMYSASQSGLLMDQNAQAVVNVSVVNSNTGFNVSYNNANGVNTTYKILSSDYNSKLILCGYTNISDPSTSFGIILTRNQFPNTTWLTEVKNNASQILPAFNATNVSNITQSKSCHTNSAATSVPVLATIFATFYTLLKIVY
ncbi:uncharacterized protein ACRADG_003948 [Cochliomyia hominivorax]